MQITSIFTFLSKFLYFRRPIPIFESHLIFCLANARNYEKYEILILGKELTHQHVRKHWIDSVGSIELRVFTSHRQCEKRSGFGTGVRKP